ncbi:thiopeptide-type bacteriocin biosynthesis protein [Sphingobacterium detergens]|uniref:Thiopeptide-type bacteriocin biosynthesis protein n=2 Tax=Sphingobacterium detergens TaxID=1145106 RepID=A0A420ADJ3_SPHD1|nr:thiopeptide-type bacteriocin biosynthesis protein [Sphingobacterium detergens]
MEFWDFTLEFFKDPQVLDAIAIASQDLFNQLQPLLNKPFTEETKNILPSIYKYISRMSNRPTPFGKFSSVSIGKISYVKTKLVLNNKFLSKYRLDYASQEIINKQLLKDEKTIENIIFYPNSTLVDNGETFSYIEFVDHISDRNFNWARINSNILIKTVIGSVSTGKTIKQIMNSIVQFGVTEIQARKFILDLIEHKILIPETEPITTVDSVNHFFNKTLKISKGTYFHKSIIELSEILINTEIEGISSSKRNNKEAFSGLYHENPKNLFQVDTMREMNEGNLNTDELSILIREIFELIHLNPSKESADLQLFAQKFYARYGDQEIPLMEALDFEKGVGYGTQATFLEKELPLLKGITGNKKNSIPDYNEFIESIVQKYSAKSDYDKRTIELKEKDFEIFKTQNHPKKTRLPLGFYIFGNLLETNSLHKDFRFHLKGCGGSSGLPLLTRFSYLDNTLKSKLVKLAQEEQSQLIETILAEIVFYPKANAGNILSRPSLFEYEIPIISQSAVDKDHTIQLSDICIKVENGKVILRSKRLNKYILPRLSSAHNFYYGMTIYRFLCDVQQQENSIKISWDWNSSMKKTFFPRISYKHLILSRAEWHIPYVELRSLNFRDDNEKIEYIIKNYQLPTKVVIANGDNEVLIDLANEIGKQIILKELNHNDLRLIENIYDEFSSPVINSDGEILSNEMIIPIIGNSARVPNSLTMQSDKSIKRKFVPGSEWLYLKIYCGERESDRIIQEELQRIVQVLKQHDNIQKWFFIRYSDPEPHLRVRFQLNGEFDSTFLIASKCINNSLEPLLENRRISKFMFDTYERELERYGFTNIENCESIFNLESETITKLLPYVKLEGENLRWKLALRMTKNLLSAFNYTIAEKITLLNLWRDSFFEEFSTIPKLKYKLDKNFREKKDEISSFMESEDANFGSILKEYNTKIILSADQCKKNNDFQIMPSRIISSLVHMLLNRIFFTKQREQEMVIYHFLAKSLISEIKRVDREN